MTASTINELTDIGFSPVSAVLIIALLSLVGAVVFLQRKNTADREAWHAETRAQVLELKEHVEACNEDRDELRRDQTQLKEKMERFIRCPRKDCPMRLP